MKFVEAKRVLAEFKGGPPLQFLLAMSGQPEPLEPFLAATAALRGYEARIRTLPFNTLAQHLHRPPEPDDREVFLLFPWDLLPRADWRSGFSEPAPALGELIAEAHDQLGRILGRNAPSIVYVDAPVPGLLSDDHASRALPHLLVAAAAEAGASILAADAASLESLFRSGFPLATGSLGMVAETVVGMLVGPRAAQGKVLVTDFDNTLWRGIVGEDGVSGLHFEPSALGFPHFVYQTYLRRLRASGILIAGVTKNDPDLARAPLETSASVLRPEDFVAIVASYNAKSTQLAEIASHLNLGMDAFAFVDDNPIELEEVRRAHPQVRIVPFPGTASGLPRLFDTLSRFFHRKAITSEDRERTEMYRRRLAGLVPKEAEGADLESFLSDLQMKLSIHDRSNGDRARAVQLINKTNQFNLNGIRRDDDEIGRLLERGGRLYTADLADRHGSHGEILAFLLDADYRIRSFVLSCRVFERRVEFAFLTWLASVVDRRLALEFTETERNEPFRRFLRDPAFRSNSAEWDLDPTAFAAAHRSDLRLFELEAQ